MQSSCEYSVTYVHSEHSVYRSIYRDNEWLYLDLSSSKKQGSLE